MWTHRHNNDDEFIITFVYFRRQTLPPLVLVGSSGGKFWQWRGTAIVAALVAARVAAVAASVAVAGASGVAVAVDVVLVAESPQLLVLLSLVLFHTENTCS